MRTLPIFLALLFTVLLGPSEEANNIDEVSIGDNPTWIVIDTLSFSLDNLKYTLDYYEVEYPEIVISQFILETGWGTSYSFRKRNNLFGLTNPRTGKYFEFTHWTESVRGYKNSVQYKYKGGDYYKFLKDLPYAMDPNYINKLKYLSKYDIQQRLDR
jgi:flagellum-specific peptidoglycan hydrolase FlgJ